MNLPTAVTALIPIKARHRCKTRLASCLTEQQRRALAGDMLQHVLHVLQQVPAISRIVVVTPERGQLAADIELLTDAGEDLNNSLSRAVTTVRRQGCKRLLIVPADLPWLSVTDIDALLAAETLAIAPSADEQGTNGLHLPAGLPFDFVFGPGSFAAHCAAAERLPAAYRVVRSPGLAFDVDTPGDYYRYRSAARHQPFFSAVSGADAL